jgi:ribosomal protein S18 acetylase RimI-like enzyme
MVNLNIDIKVVTRWKKEEIVALYKSAGWWKESYNSSQIQTLIAGSYAFAVVVDTKSKKTIGMGRILSDGVSDAYLQDVVILPEYQGYGIGKKLVQFLLNYCLSRNIYWIGLISEPNQNQFYSSLGFKLMDNYTPMKYQSEA